MHKLICLVITILGGTILNGQKSETVYLNSNDSSSNRYIILYPKEISWKGFMFLIPGMFQTPEDVLIQTDLPKHAARKGILTIIPTFKTGISSFGIDTATQASFVEILKHVTEKNNLKDKRFYIGGFSIGGTCALKYAELAQRNHYTNKPNAVFAIDSPLDFERMYNTIERELQFSNVSQEIRAENIYMLNRFKDELGGSPVEVSDSYHALSPYSFKDSTQHAIRSLINMPIRLYTEPDILLSLADGVDYSGMNAFDFAAMTNELNKLGNTKIELIITTNKGYRKPGNKRNPHSWSIAEPKDLVKWLLAQQ